MYNVKAFLQDNQVPFKTSGTNVTIGWIEIKCPFPACTDHSTHMGINLANGYFNCWICGERGSFTRLVSVLLQIPWSQAEKIAIEYFKPSVALLKAPREHRNILFQFPKEATEKLPAIHKEYLINRGYDPKLLVEKYHIRACYQTGKYSYRIIIPIIMYGQFVSFTARSVFEDQEPRYKNMPSEESIIPTKQCLYGIDDLEERQTAVIVEGVFDQWRIGDGAIATLGIQTTPTQVKIIVEKKLKTCFVLYDNGASKEANKLANSLAPFINHVEVIEISGYKDPGEMNEKDVKLLRKELRL